MHLTIFHPKDFKKISFGKIFMHAFKHAVRFIVWVIRWSIYMPIKKAGNFVWKIHKDNMEVISIFNKRGILTEDMMRKKFPIYLLAGLILSTSFMMLVNLSFEVEAFVAAVIFVAGLVLDLFLFDIREIEDWKDDDPNEEYNGPL